MSQTPPVIGASAQYIASYELHSLSVCCHNTRVKQRVTNISFVLLNSCIKLYRGKLCTEAHHTESVVLPAFQSNKGQDCLRVEEVVFSTYSTCCM